MVKCQCRKKEDTITQDTARSGGLILSVLTELIIIVHLAICNSMLYSEHDNKVWLAASATNCDGNITYDW